MSSIRYKVHTDEGGNALFLARRAAIRYVAKLDAKGVGHGPIERIDLGYDPADVRRIGGGVE